MYGRIVSDSDNPPGNVVFTDETITEKPMGDVFRPQTTVIAALTISIMKHLKGVVYMILFSILLITAILLILFAVLCLSIGGTIFTIIFADVIVCVALIVLLMYKLFHKKHR